MSNAIETRQLTCRASRTFAIHDLDLNVPSGSIYGFLGPNGSGKTTTIRLVLGLLRAAGGSIEVLGHAIPGDAHRMLAQTGYVPERPHLYPSLRIDEALRFHSAFYPTWDRAWADGLLRSFGLDATMRIGRLSKGEVGKLMTLMALAQRPRLLVLDEPTDGLDPLVRRQVLAALMEYVAEEAATVFISSHLVHELERFCNWIGVLDDGRLVAEMPMQSFKNGIKRLRVKRAPPATGDLPFVLLSRESENGGAEQWVVRGWQPPMRQYFEGVGAELADVADLDLEDGFVELLRTARSRRERE
jgi:ABC-2 type transport system ATP-binding protein